MKTRTFNPTLSHLAGALLCLGLLFCITSCATTRGAADTSSIVGKWFFDYRDNQDSTTVQVFDFKADGTITGYLKNQDTYYRHMVIS